MTNKLIEPKVAKLKPVAEVPVFTPCEQCGYPDDCAKANRCVKGFK